MKVGDMVRLRPEVMDAHGIITRINPKFYEPAERLNKGHGIITDENPYYYFVKWFNCPVYGSEGNLAHKESELEVISGS